MIWSFRMDELPKRKIGLPSLDLLVFLAVGVVLSALCVPMLSSSRRASNERHASTSLKTLTSAEADFRANDRDENRVNDFWTGDVSGLYYVKPQGGGPEIRLIEEPLANADPRPLFPLQKGSVPWVGYRYHALDRDDSVKGPEGVYRQDTDKSGRRVHHESRFGFSAFPEALGSGGYIFTVNENNTIIRDAIDRTKGIIPRTRFPADGEWMNQWSQGD